ncbi:MAG TPA: hypothetical protein VK212_05985 [Lentimicrobium sp.]|nr:hypothetical protein [Lentimicrobium sp.]
MTIRIKLLILLIIVAIISASCKHDYIPDDFLNKELYLKRQTINWKFTGHHDTTESIVSTQIIDFIYDTSGRLIKAGDIQFIYGNDGKLIATENDDNIINYNWNGDHLMSVSTHDGYYDGGSFIDTTLFNYSNGIFLNSFSTNENTNTDFVFKDEKVVAKYITHTQAGIEYCDSLLYKWKDGNLISIQTCSSFPWSNYLYVREFSYDNRPSWTSTIHYPSEYLFVREITQFYSSYPLFYYEIFPWRYNCRNNPVEFTERTNDQVKVTNFQIIYNKEGYPSSITGANFSIQLEYY